MSTFVLSILVSWSVFAAGPSDTGMRLKTIRSKNRKNREVSRGANQ